MQTQINGYDVIHIDKNTGDVICETQGCTLIKDNMKSEEEIKAEIYKQEHELNFNKGEKFVKMFADIAYKLALHLPATEYRVAFGLSKFISYESCILEVGYGYEKHNMTLDDISREMKLQYKTASRIISSLIKKGVLAQVKTGQLQSSKTTNCYVVNPYIYLNGKNPTKEVVQHFFTNSGWIEIMNSDDDISE